jgi:uncharacterized protein (DUF3084 family)
MTSGYILIATILILGGIIAVSGDRIGSKVGKARLTLFKLRPRQTATLLTIVAGTLISGMVLSLIFGTSPELRTGVFNLQSLQKKLFDTTQSLNDVLQQKDRIERELEEARNVQLAARNLLSGVAKSFKDEILKQSVAAQNLKNTQQQLESVGKERSILAIEVAQVNRDLQDLKTKKPLLDEQVKDLSTQLQTLENKYLSLQKRFQQISSDRSRLLQELEVVSVQKDLDFKRQKVLEYEIDSNQNKRDQSEIEPRILKVESQLKTKQSELIELESQIKQNQQKLEVRKVQLKGKDQQYLQLEREFQSRAANLKQKDRELKKLDAQIEARGQGLASIEKEVNNLEQEYKKVRKGNIGILRNQVLAADILKAGNPETATQSIQNLLLRANLVALKATHPDDPNSSRQIIKITSSQLEQLKQQITGSNEYVVRVFSTENYVIGDNNIEVFIDATPNQKLFKAGEDLGAVTVDPRRMNEEQIRQQINILVFRLQLRARQVGILDDRVQIGDGQLTTYVQFLEQIKQQKYLLEIKAMVRKDTYTSDPLVIDLQPIASRKKSPL